MGGDGEVLRHRGLKSSSLRLESVNGTVESWPLSMSVDLTVNGLCQVDPKRDGYRARAERDEGAPFCDSFARRGRGLDRTWASFSTEGSTFPDGFLCGEV